MSEVASLAHDANIKNLALIHHDPDQDDDAIDKSSKAVSKNLRPFGSSTKVTIPVEGSVLNLNEL